jgi:hypothetical protein
LPSLMSSLQAAPSQHGFRPDRSTTTALLPLCQQISEGFNATKPASRSAFVAIDISKTFDTVDVTLLLQEISSSGLHHNLVRWLSSYLRGRKATCVYQGCRSKYRTIDIGVPQGSVLSPPLFNFFTSDFPDVSGSKPSFADDFTIGKSDPDPKVIAAALNRNLVRFSKWAKRERLIISAEKLQVAFFSPWNRENSFPHLL